jgi:response regulator RpfG family c-di-GMP phosphodiesterase
MSKKHYVFLIVEAGQTGLSTRKMILETAGYNVLSAVTGVDALAMSKQHPTDAVLFDVDVHDMPARELLSQLKQERPDRPIFLLHSRPWPPDDIKGLVDGVFEKMDDPHKMVHFLEEHFERKP